MLCHFKLLPALTLLLVACQSSLPPTSTGGDLSSPAPTPTVSRQLNPEQRLALSTGASLFNKPWVSAPSTTADRDGLGPLFNAHSCAACHRNNGRGTLPGDSTLQSGGLLFRLPRGRQLQTRALPGFKAEGQVKIQYRPLTKTFADGYTVTLRQPVYTADRNKSVSPRLAPSLQGMGLVAAIPVNGIRAGADPEDVNGDGISGRALNTEQGIGRFGWKAEQASLEAQTALAFVEDIGITSPQQPKDHCDATTLECRRVSGGSPEIGGAGIQAVVDYLSALTVARSRLQDTHRKGWTLFRQAGCAQCHHPRWQTAATDNPLTSKQTIYPFSDFLLHDMGPGLADHGDSPLAAEWRTAPLWGLAQSEGRYLHDGRARTVLEAILWHGGEAEAALQKVLQFDGRQRAALLEFLAAL